MTIAETFRMLEAERLSDPAPGELQVCFATDGGYADKVEVAAFSLLSHATCPIRLVIIGTDDVIGAFGRLERLVDGFPQARLEYVTPTFLREAGRTHRHRLPIAAFGRMLIPHLMSGRVLYLDGDTLIRRDVAPALTMDLGGHPAAACIDQLILRLLRRSENARQNDSVDRTTRDAEDSIAEFRSYGVDIDRYYNSGVMIFDCDAIRRDPALMRDSLDHKRAEAFMTFDQDLVNLLYSGRMQTLPPEWNVWHGISRTARAPFTPEDRARHATARRDPIILHFYHAPKPWSKLSLKHLQRGFRWHRAYWRAQRAYARRIA